MSATNELQPDFDDRRVFELVILGAHSLLSQLDALLDRHGAPDSADDQPAARLGTRAALTADVVLGLVSAAARVRQRLAELLPDFPAEDTPSAPTAALPLKLRDLLV